MSWIKELFDFSNDSENQFTKWASRIVVIIFVLIVLFFAYEIFSGKIIHLGTGTYGVYTTIDSSNSKQNPTNGTVIVPKPDPNVTKVSTNPRSANSAMADITVKDTSRINKILNELIGNQQNSLIYVDISYNKFDNNSAEYANQLKNYLANKGYTIHSCLATTKPLGADFLFDYDKFPTANGGVLYVQIGSIDIARNYSIRNN